MIASFWVRGFSSSSSRGAAALSLQEEDPRACPVRRLVEKCGCCLISATMTIMTILCVLLLILVVFLDFWIRYLHCVRT